MAATKEGGQGKGDTCDPNPFKLFPSPSGWDFQLPRLYHPLYVSPGLSWAVWGEKANLMFLFGFASQNFIYFQCLPLRIYAKACLEMARDQKERRRREKEREDGFEFIYVGNV
jgi:hypothetical protein